MNAAAEEESAGGAWVGGPLEVAWSDDAGRAVELPLVTSGESLFVTTTDKKLFCYELGTGKKIWRRRFKADLPCAPAVLAAADTTIGVLSRAGGRVFLQVGAREDAKLYALRADDGKDVWKLPSYPRVTQLLVADGRLFSFDLAGTLRRLDPEDGSVVWSRDGFGWDPPGLVAGDGTLYVLARADSLLALVPETGERIWATHVAGRYVGRPYLDGGRIFLAAIEGQVYEVGRADGSVRALGGRRRAQQLLSPVPLGGRVLTVSSDGWVEAGVDSGGETWSADLGESVRDTPLPAGGLLIVPTSGGRLVALRGDTGAQVWSLELGERLATAPLLTDRYLVVATNQGDVYAYEH